MKKVILIFLTITIFTSCKITKSLWQSNFYEDKIQNFVTTKNGNQVAFLGEQYHYIIDDSSGVLKRLFFWRQHQILYIDTNESELQLDEFNNIGGYVQVRTIVSGLSPQDAIYLQWLGFAKDQQNNWSGKIFVSGKRYMPNYGNYRAYSLNREYKIKIYYPLDSKSRLKQVGKVIVSPITIVLDVFLWFGEKAVLIAN